MRCTPSSPATPTWRPASANSSASPSKSSRLIPKSAWQYLELSDDADVDERIEQIAAAERAAVCDLTGPPLFRAALIGLPDNRHRLVLSIHHIVIDGWSLPILLQEIFANYFGQRLPEPVAYRNFVSWLAGQDRDVAQAAVA